MTPAEAARREVETWLDEQEAGWHGPYHDSLIARLTPVFKWAGSWDASIKKGWVPRERAERAEAELLQAQTDYELASYARRHAEEQRERAEAKVQLLRDTIQRLASLSGLGTRNPR